MTQHTLFQNISIVYSFVKRARLSFKLLDKSEFMFRLFEIIIIVLKIAIILLATCFKGTKGHQGLSETSVD